MRVEVFLDGREGLFTALCAAEGALHFILDDDGALSLDVEAVELLETYYRSLNLSGLAWLRIPKTIWVMQKSNRRILLSEYLLAKFPSIFRTVLPTEMDGFLLGELSQNKEIIEMKKNRAYLELKTGVKIRSCAHSLKSGTAKSRPVLEYGEES